MSSEDIQKVVQKVLSALESKSSACCAPGDAAGRSNDRCCEPLLVLCLCKGCS